MRDSTVLLFGPTCTTMLVLTTLSLRLTCLRSHVIYTFIHLDHGLEIRILLKDKGRKNCNLFHCSGSLLRCRTVWST